MSREARRNLVSILGLLYLFGEMSQVFSFGPLWLRWHLSDFGFPLALAGTLVTLWHVKTTKVALLVATTIAMLLEVFQGLTSSITSSGFDPIDFGLFAIACIVGFAIMGKSEKLHFFRIGIRFIA